MYEYLEHINQLFCYHLFIGLPHEIKKNLLQRYHILQLKKRTNKLDFLFASYSENLMYFHDAILNNNEELFVLYQSMKEKSIKILREIKVIRKATQDQHNLPDHNIIPLEKVYAIQKELQKPSLITPITFSLSDL
jgi:hypothetical protein